MMITRDRGKPAAVPMRPENFASHEESEHLLKSPAYAGRVL